MDQSESTLNPHKQEENHKFNMTQNYFKMGEQSFLSYGGRSVQTNGGGLAVKIGNALSKIMFR